MTDNEIINAWIVILESSQRPTEYLINDTIDLINSQKAEIEKRGRAFEELIKVARLWKEKYNNAKAENERLNTYLDVISCSTDKIKAEAIKEFAERLDSMFAKIENELPKNKIVKATIQVYKDMLQIVKKEMVGAEQ